MHWTRSLAQARALTPTEDITPMGRLLSKLPTDVHLGKFLLIATLFRCLDPALTIAAALNSKSPFLTPLGLEAEAERAKASFRIGFPFFRQSLWRTHSESRRFRLFDTSQRFQQLAKGMCQRRICLQVLSNELHQPSGEEIILAQFGRPTRQSEYATNRRVASTISRVLSRLGFRSS